MTSRGVAIVTGASRGIGLGVADHLHGRGHQILTCSRGPLPDRADGWLHLETDLGTAEGVDALLDHPLVAEASVLVNNIGQIRAVGGLEAETPEQVADTFATNLFGPIECARRVAPVLAASGRGTIVNISSIYGPINPAFPVMSYAASKAALAAATRAMAVELASSGVRVNAVAPGNIDTEMTRAPGPEFVDEVIAKTPLGRLGRTEDIAEAVGFLVDASFVTGHLLVVDGGISLVGG